MDRTTEAYQDKGETFP